MCLFSQLPLVSPLSNVLVAPLLPLVCGLGLIACVLLMLLPEVGLLVMAAAGNFCAILSSLVGLLSEIPFSCVPFAGEANIGLLFSAVACALLWATWPDMSRRLMLGVAGCFCLAIFACYVALPASSGIQIVALDVGQGDAILVRDGSAAMLIDTGTNDSMLREGLARQGVAHLDAVLISHADDDHCGSLSSLRGIVDVDTVLVASDALTCDCASCQGLISSAKGIVGEGGLVGLNLGDQIACGRMTLEVVWPESFQDEGGNADSLCVLASADEDTDGVCDGTAFLCGDAEAEQLEEMIEKGMLGKVDVYKVGHHGSRAALNDEVVAALSPSVSLVSVGEGNRYGHPVQSTLDLLTGVGSVVYRTDLQGDITCRFSGGSIYVTTEK